jgi:predicted ATPase
MQLGSLEITGLSNRPKVQMDFRPGINIVYGQNGVGKTTILHVIGNLINQAFPKFLFLDFKTIHLHTDNGEVHLTKSNDKLMVSGGSGMFLKSTQTVSKESYYDQKRRREIEEETSYPFEHKRAETPFAYFPAFRSVIETDILQGYTRNTYRDPRSPAQKGPTIQDIFGQFVPDFSFPGLEFIETSLTSQINEAVRITASIANKIMIDIGLGRMIEVLEKHATLKKSKKSFEQLQNDIISKIEQMNLKYGKYNITTSQNTPYEKLKSVIVSFKEPPDKSPHKRLITNILSVFDIMLSESIDRLEQAFQGTNLFFEEVNKFIKPKSISYAITNSLRGSIGFSISYENHKEINSLRQLSSGEKHIIALLYQASRMSKKSVVLIDEPELSLHVDWQQMIMQAMRKQMSSAQIIACTHSPIILEHANGHEIALRY